MIVPSALARALASLMARIAVARASNFFASLADNPLGAAARPSSTSPSTPDPPSPPTQSSPYPIIRFADVVPAPPATRRRSARRLSPWFPVLRAQRRGRDWYGYRGRQGRERSQRRMIRALARTGP